MEYINDTHSKVSYAADRNRASSYSESKELITLLVNHLASMYREACGLEPSEADFVPLPKPDDFLNTDMTREQLISLIGGTHVMLLECLLKLHELHKKSEEQVFKRLEERNPHLVGRNYSVKLDMSKDIPLMKVNFV